MMKKITFYLLIWSLLPFILNAQSQNQFPGSDFETGWVNKTGINGPYVDFQTDFFYTLNSLYAEENTNSHRVCLAYSCCIGGGMDSQPFQYRHKPAGSREQRQPNRQTAGDFIYLQKTTDSRVQPVRVLD